MALKDLYWSGVIGHELIWPCQLLETSPLGRSRAVSIALARLQWLLCYRDLSPTLCPFQRLAFILVSFAALLKLK